MICSILSMLQNPWQPTAIQDTVGWVRVYVNLEWGGVES